jgi:hypothetical protein
MNPASAQKRIAFGYNRDGNKIVVNEGQAACVKIIFDYYLEGKSLSAIKEILEGVGIPSPQNKPTWGKQTLSNILSNPHYLGSEEYPPLISQDVFDKVQELKTK